MSRVRRKRERTGGPGGELVVRPGKARGDPTILYGWKIGSSPILFRHSSAVSPP
jgi:hypothetical protein